MLRARLLTAALLAALLTAVPGPGALAQESGDPTGSGSVTGPGSGEVVVEAPGSPGGSGGGGGGGGKDTGCVSTFINKTVPGHPVQSGEGGYYFVAGAIPSSRVSRASAGSRRAGLRPPTRARWPSRSGPS